MRRALSIFILLAFFGLSNWAMASEEHSSVASSQHIRLELFSAAPTEQGPAFDVGVRIVLEPGWHIYAQTPGDVGKPTVVHWSFPKGTKEISAPWPKPTEFESAGLKSYGYEGKLELVTQVTPPSDTDLEAVATVEWLLCKDECIPGVATLRKTFSMRSEAGSQVSPEGVGKLNSAVSSQVPLSPGFVRTLLLAFAGGMLLNLMPCVFPVLSMKILNLVEHRESENPARHGIAFAAGVLSSFWVLAAISLAVRALGMKIGWGFQLQSPTFIAVVGMVVFAVALNLLGVFEIGFRAQRVAGKVDTGFGYGGTFLSGVLATLLATPCSAPFMATALAATLSMHALPALCVFTALGLGMSAPYCLLTARPDWLRFLPRPGVWMVHLKQLMAFPLLATVIWLMWVLGQQQDTDTVIRFMWGLLFSALGLWIYGLSWSSGGPNGFQRFLASGAIGLACYLGIPTSGTTASASPTFATQEVSGGIQSEPYSSERLVELKRQKMPVLLEFTAAWCLTCQVNHKVLFGSEAVAQEMKAKRVTLMVGDWTRGDPVITDALASLGRTGVPLSLLIDPNQASPVVFPQLLDPSVLLEALRKIPVGVASAAPVEKPKVT